MSKRLSAATFRDRLAQLRAGSGLTQTAFAAEIGIDRSALSQLAAEQNPRLPRAETLIALSQRFGVSTDWILGLSDNPGQSAQVLSAVETEQELDSENRTAMERWHREATGQKVRYVPAWLPDLMRTPAVIAYQAQSSDQERRRLQRQTDRRLTVSRQPETDIEMCMPLQTLEIFALGAGNWTGLKPADRREQLAHIATTVEELYPSFRMYLFDGRKRFAPPMMIFGYLKAAVYTGETYLLIRSKQLIRDLAQGFDSHIRNADIHAHQAADWVRRLKVG